MTSQSDAQQIDAAAGLLEDITSHTSTPTISDPHLALSTPSAHATTQTWFRRLFAQQTLEEWGNSYHWGNYVVDRRSGVKTFEEMSVCVRVGMHLLYYGSLEGKVLHWSRSRTILEAQSVKMGRWYDSAESRKHIWPFIRSFGLEASLDDLLEPDPSEYPTFNAFFARAMRPSARPIAAATDSSVLSSAADCRLTAFLSTDQATRYWIKGVGFTLATLLGNAAVAQDFDGGAMLIHRLAPQDYHRWHAPCDGTVEDVKKIPGTYYTVNPQAVTHAPTISVFTENRRSVMLLRRRMAGSSSRVAIVAVGAMLVGSIRYLDGVDVPGTTVSRGQPLGAFQYGGSTVIVLFEPHAAVPDADLVANSTVERCETYVRVGERVGAITVAKSNGDLLCSN